MHDSLSSDILAGDEVVSDKYMHLCPDDDIFDEQEDRNDDSAKDEYILDDDLPDFSGASHDNNGNTYPDTDR